MALGLTVGDPLPDTQINIGETLTVTGLAKGEGLPEPVIIDTVTVQLGNETPVEATIKFFPNFAHPTSTPAWPYSAEVQVTVPSGPTDIVVRANFSGNQHVTEIVPVIASSPGNPLVSTFNAIARLQTTNSHANKPFSKPIFVETMFSGDRQTVVVTNFPPLTDNVDTGTPLGTDTITVTLIGGGIGTFERVSSPPPRPGEPPIVRGALFIPVTLLFHHSISALGDSTLNLLLSTGAERSPTGAFNDTGTPMNLNGEIVLVGDGTFSGGFLGSSDASLVLTGTFSPVPLEGSVTHPLPC